MSYYAVDMRSQKDKASSPQRKREPVAYDPIAEGSKTLADVLYDDAYKLSLVLAPDVPSDTEELDSRLQWQVLETLALTRSPHTWEDPDALEDYLRLTKQFMPANSERLEYLRPVIALRKVEQKGRPDLNVTPTSAEWAERNK